MANLKEKLRNGEAVHGCWLNMGSSISAEIIAHAGFDWALVDLEHGAGPESSLITQLQALGSSSTVPMVRVESFERPRVQRVLDMGVHGVMFPRIRNVEEAREAVANMHYPPKGQRGLAKMVRATQYGKDFDGYLAFTQQELLGIIQIETRECLEDLDAIAALEGVDVLFVGPSDLSLALGIFGQWDHPVFVEAVRATGEAARRHGKAAGVLFLDPGQYEFYYDHGFRFLACGSDMTFLSQGATAMARLLDEQRLKKS